MFSLHLRVVRVETKEEAQDPYPTVLPAGLITCGYATILVLRIAGTCFGIGHGFSFGKVGRENWKLGKFSSLAQGAENTRKQSRR